MNKTFKVIWNHAVQNWVAVSELNKAKGKTKSLSLAKKGIFNVSLISSGLALMCGQAMAITGAENQPADSTVNYCYYKSDSPRKGQVVCGGVSTQATGNGAIAIGAISTQATGTDSIAMGIYSQAIGDAAIAIGRNTTAQATNSNGATAIGDNSKVNGDAPIAIGNGNTVNGSYSNAIGWRNSVNTSFSSAFGFVNTIAGGVRVTAVGQDNKIFNSNLANALGNANFIGSTTNSAQNGIAIGNDNHVFSVNSISMGVLGRVGARWSTSIGAQNIIGSTSESSTVLGSNIKVGATGVTFTPSNDGNHTVVYQNQTRAAYTVAIGNGINVNNSDNAIAVGRNTTVNASDSIAMGTNAVSNTANSVVIGTNAKDTTKMGYSQATAVGSFSTAANDSVAIGSGASATGDITDSTHSGWATAVGRLSNASGRGGIAVGNEAAASGIDSAAFGSYAKASANSAYSFGYRSSASGDSSIAFGFRANASGEFSTGLGRSTKATGESSIALAHSAEANGDMSIALGYRAWANGFGSIASGNQASATGLSSIAFGTIASARGDQSLALGFNTYSFVKDSVALGSNSRTDMVYDPVVGTSNTTVNGIRYGDFAGANPLSTVSVGNTYEKRTITNVAAGRILANSTDAINGSQLYMVASKLAEQINNVSKTMTWNATATANSDGVVKNSTNAIVSNNDTVTFEAGKNITITQDGRKFTIEATGSGSTTNVVVDAGEGIQVNSTTNGNNVTYTVTAKTDGTTIKIDNNGNISAVTTDLNVVGGKVEEPTGSNASALVNATTVTKAINNSGFTLKTSATPEGQKEASSTGEELITPGKTVEMVAGKNLTVKQSANGTITYATKDDVNFKSVTVGNTTITHDGVRITGGPSITTNGIDAGNKKITNVAPGEISATSKDAVNGSQLYAVGNNINNLNNRVNKIDKDLRAGIAGAAAIAGLPQVRGNGKSMMAVAASNYRGENAVALGYTRASDNGKVLLKLSGSTNTRGDVVSAIGLGYEW